MELEGHAGVLDCAPGLLDVLRHAPAISDHLHLRDVLNLRASCRNGGKVRSLCASMPLRVLDCSRCLKLRCLPELPDSLTI